MCLGDAGPALRGEWVDLKCIVLLIQSANISILYISCVPGMALLIIPHLIHLMYLSHEYYTHTVFDLSILKVMLKYIYNQVKDNQ